MYIPQLISYAVLVIHTRGKGRANVVLAASSVLFKVWVGLTITKGRNLNLILL